MIKAVKEEYEKQSLYGKLSEAEAEAVSGEEGEDFLVFAKKLRESVHGAV